VCRYWRELQTEVPWPFTVDTKAGSRSVVLVNRLSLRTPLSDENADRFHGPDLDSFFAISNLEEGNSLFGMKHSETQALLVPLM
jgi:hypothetical protein